MKTKQSKFQQWKSAMKNTPPERLLKINMQGFVMQSIGLITVCTVILLQTTWWWLIFAFIFGLFNQYSGFVSNYQQYIQILEYKKLAGIKDEEDKSPHRKKAKLIKEVLGKKVGWITAFASAVISYSIIPGDWKWYFKSPSILLLILVSYYLIYFKFFYYIAKRRSETSFKENIK